MVYQPEQVTGKRLCTVTVLWLRDISKATNSHFYLKFSYIKFSSCFTQVMKYNTMYVTTTEGKTSFEENERPTFAKIGFVLRNTSNTCWKRISLFLPPLSCVSCLSPVRVGVASWLLLVDLHSWSWSQSPSQAYTKKPWLFHLLPGHSVTTEVGSIKTKS